MSQSFIRIPPDGAGKRLSTGTHLEINYRDLSGDFQVGDTVSGSVTGALGKIIRVAPTSATEGEIYVKMPPHGPSALVEGETLTAIGAVPTGVATVVGQGIPFHTSKTGVVGENNPFYGQAVDIQGAASVRFAEGSPLFDAFGGQKISQPNTIGVYEFSSDGGFGLFSTEITGAATDTYSPATSTVNLTCGPDAGDSVKRTSNKCHYYWPGNGTTIIMSAALSDTGVTGNTRRLGFYDDFDGIYFEMKDTTAYVCLRSSSLGTVVRVPQSEWSVDRLDGTGLSGISIEWNRSIVYFIDLQWLGAGRVRAGIIGPDGSRVVVHEFQNSGKNIYPYMKTGSLPVRGENFNTEATGATTTLRITCMVVKCDGLVDYTYYRNSSLHPPVAVTAENRPLISLRAKALYGGRRNPTNTFVEEYSCFVSGGAVRIDFCWPITLTGDTWAVDMGATEVDTAATAATVDDDLWVYASYYAAAGAHVIPLRDFFEANDEGIITNADGTAWPWNVVATPIEGTPTVQGCLSWKELR